MLNIKLRLPARVESLDQTFEAGFAGDEDYFLVVHVEQGGWVVRWLGC
jgi:hypothetical protein